MTTIDDLFRIIISNGLIIYTKFEPLINQPKCIFKYSKYSRVGDIEIVSPISNKSLCIILSSKHDWKWGMFDYIPEYEPELHKIIGYSFQTYITELCTKIPKIATCLHTKPIKKNHFNEMLLDDLTTNNMKKIFVQLLLHFRVRNFPIDIYWQIVTNYIYVEKWDSVGIVF